MLVEIFKALLITSFAASCLAAVITLVRPISKRAFGYSWNYYIWLAALIVAVLPVRFAAPLNTDFAPAPIAPTTRVEQTYIGEQADALTGEDTSAPQTVRETIAPNILQQSSDYVKDLVNNRSDLFALFWLAGFLVLLSINILSYIRLMIKLRKSSIIVSCPELADYTRKKIITRIWKGASSPFIIGIFRPALVLPARELSQEQLRNILRHEITHLKRLDILYKWFAQLVKCLHWFNPVIWYVTKQIEVECEISCDMSVVKDMTKDEELSYVNTILELALAERSKRIPFTTQMAGGKKILKRRFTMIKNKRKTSRTISILSAVIAAFIMSSAVFASGALAGFARENYTIEIANNGADVELVNKPFIENGEVYLPLRETLEKVGVLERDGADLSYDDGEIFIVVTPGAGREEMVTYAFDFKIGERALRHGILRETRENADLVFDDTMYNPPLLEGSVAYIPYEWIDLMLNGRYQDWNIDYTVFDTDGTDRTADVIKGLSRQLCRTEALKISPNYENESSLCYEVTRTFFGLMEAGDIQSMRTYCTPEFAESAFTDDTFLGYGYGMAWSVYSVYLYSNGDYRVTLSFYPYNDMSDDNMDVLSVTFKIQSDGSALIAGVDTVSGATA